MYLNKQLQISALPSSLCLLATIVRTETLYLVKDFLNLIILYFHMTLELVVALFFYWQLLLSKTLCDVLMAAMVTRL